MVKTTTNYGSSLSRTRNWKGHLTGHVTLTSQVRYGTNLDSSEFLDPNNVRNKTSHLSNLTITIVSNGPVSKSGLDLPRSR